MAKTATTTKKTPAPAVNSQQHDDHDHPNHDHDHDHQHNHDHQHHQHSQDALLAPNEKITLTLKWSVLEPVYKKNLAQAAKSFKAEGFRAGRAPLNLVEQQIGAERLTEAILRDVLPQAAEEALKKAEKKAITRPEFAPLKVKKGEDWLVELIYAAFPEVEVKNYKKAVADANKAAAKFITEREKQRREEAAKAKTEAKSPVKPATALELSEEEKQQIRLQHIFQALVAESQPKIPELLLRQETQAEFERLLKQLEQYQIKLDDYLKNRGITMEILSNELASSVLGRLQVDFILAAISQLEKLKVAPEEITAALEKITNLKLRAEAKANQNYLVQLEANLLQRKTVDFLLKI